jgi:hypothetical protein
LLFSFLFVYYCCCLLHVSFAVILLLELAACAAACSLPHVLPPVAVCMCCLLSAGVNQMVPNSREYGERG